MPRKRKGIIRKRAPIFICALVAAVMLGLVCRLFYLQVVEGGYYSAKALNQQLDESSVAATRGSVYDRNMKVLAQSAPVWTLYVSTTKLNAAKRAALAQGLSGITGIAQTTLADKLQKTSGYIVLQRQIEKTEADAINAYVKKNKLDCVGLEEDSKRYYPYGNFAASVLGFVGSDSQGLAGIELAYDSELRGEPGKVISAKNAQGKEMSTQYNEYIAPKNGSNVVLTIDEVVQHYLESSLKKAYTDNKVSGKTTGIVMDINSGEILGMATYPDFNPNSPYTLSAADLAQLTGLTGSALTAKRAALLQEMWRNKAISDPYETGSVFKIITASAGLEEGVVNLQTPFYDPGSIKIADRTFACWKKGGHGQQTFLQGFGNSCNVVFIELGEMLGAANFYKYFSGFGLTEKTGIDLPGEAKNIYYTENQLGKVQLASCAFGQSDKLTAVSLLTAVAAAANGGYLVAPHVVKEETDASGNVIKSAGTTVKRQVISQATSKTIDYMLQMEVEQGTGKNAYVAGYRVGGKTGTAQKLDSKDPNECIASFVGVAPCDAPQIAVLFLMDDPHNPVSDFGGVIAAPVVGNLMSEVLPYLGVVPKYTTAELAKLDIKTPDVTGRKVSDAVSYLKAQGLQVTQYGSGDTVTGQVPLSGNPIPKNGRITIYTGSAQMTNSVSVPDLTGLTPAAAKARLEACGLNISIAGDSSDSNGDKAYEQDYAAGTKVAPGTVVTVKFRNEEIKVR